MCDHIRGKSVEEARAILALTPRAVAEDWQKLLESAVANAEHNHELVGDDLKIVAVFADEGPTLKRFRPRAMGRATRIRKRTRHLTITLTPKELRTWDRRFIPSPCAWATSTTGSRNWFNERNFADYLAEDVAIRRHIVGKLSHAGLSQHHDPQGRQRGGGQHPHRAPRHRHRQVRHARSTRCAATCTA